MSFLFRYMTKREASRLLFLFLLLIRNIVSVLSAVNNTGKTVSDTAGACLALGLDVSCLGERHLCERRAKDLVNEGDTLKIDTRTGEYLSRV